MLHLRLPRHARRLARIATTTGLLAFACGGPPPSDPAAKLPPEATGPANPGEPVTPAPALPDDGRIALDPAQAQLRTGTAAPIAEPAMVGEAQDLATTEANPHDGGTYLRVALPALGALAGAYEPRVHVDQALALFDGTQVVVRWPRGVTVPERVEGTLYYAGEAGSWSESPRWHARPFSAPRPKASAASSTRDPAPAVFAWASALESHFGRSRAWEATHPWYAFARERIAAAVRAQASDRHGPDTGGFGPGTRQTDLARLMDTTTANLSIQEVVASGLAPRAHRAEARFDEG